MYTSLIRRRALLLFVCLPPGVLLVGAGAGCPFELPTGNEPFGLDLVNSTSFEVDPHVLVNGYLLDLGALAPLEGTDRPVAYDVDCFPDDALTVDPILSLTPDTSVLAADGPIGLTEGVDFVCGDIIELEFSHDETGAFVADVFVNDVLITPSGVDGVDVLGIDMVNHTTFEVDPGVHVDEFLLGLGTLVPLEGTDLAVEFNVACFTGDTLTIEPLLFLTPDTTVVTANGPVVLEEGIDYVCSDILRLEFSQDGTGTFFVDVFVNGVLINP